MTIALIESKKDPKRTEKERNVEHKGADAKRHCLYLSATAKDLSYLCFIDGELIRERDHLIKYSRSYRHELNGPLRLDPIMLEYLLFVYMRSGVELSPNSEVR